MRGQSGTTFGERHAKLKTAGDTTRQGPILLRFPINGVNTPVGGGVRFASVTVLNRSRFSRRVNAVLILEGLADDATQLRLTLEQAKVANPVMALLSGAEAKAYLEGAMPYSDRLKFPPARTVFLNLKLAGTDGFEFLKWLRASAQFKDVLAIAVSAENDLGSIRRAYELGANSFITKPCSIADVENLITGFPDYWNQFPE
jgi:CheY-like chemotaxis protein